MNGENRRVVVAMSGGVDSSVAAALLVEQGYEVIGMMLRLWNEPGLEIYNRCCTPEAMSLARRVAAHLEIPFYTVDAQSIFRETVVEYFITGYAQGNTPNPCLECNRYVRWEYLLERARALGCNFMATGHYARLRRNHLGPIQLLRGIDRNKDQSYILHILTQNKLSQALFPLGELTKPEVRQLANYFGLPVADRPESQDLCFLGPDDYRDFLKRNVVEIIQPGEITDIDGNRLGYHQGLAFYTIGQRKGLGISSSRPFYVIEKDRVSNRLIVGPKEALGKNELIATQLNWVSGEPPSQSFRTQIKIRYKSPEVWGWVTPLEDGDVHVQFDEPLRDITPGQASVFYDQEICLGGGIIKT